MERSLRREQTINFSCRETVMRRREVASLLLIAALLYAASYFSLDQKESVRATAREGESSLSFA